MAGDQVYDLHAIGPGTIRLRESAELPPCNAEVIMHVDDCIERWQVYLPDGLSPTGRNARTVQLTAAQVRAGL